MHPVTNKIPTCICSVGRGFHTYISTNPQLEELTRKVRTGLGDKQVFQRINRPLYRMSLRQVSSLTAKSNACKFLSGLFVIDIDELASTEEAAMWRDRLFADEVLAPRTFLCQPRKPGSKTVYPLPHKPFPERGRILRQCPAHRMEYLEWKYELKVDRANADLSRACFLSHDGEAKINNHKY